MAPFERITHRAMAVAAVGEVTNTNHFCVASFAQSRHNNKEGWDTHPTRKLMINTSHLAHTLPRKHPHTHAHTRTRTLGCARLSTLNMNVGVSSNGCALCTCASRSGSVVCGGLNALLLLTDSVQSATLLAAVLSICCSRSAHLSAPLLSSRG
jgi:hypothetical protein